MKYLVVFICAMAPLLAFATDETCPAGYQPDEYIELEYIDNDNLAYLDLGIPVGTTDEFILDISWNSWNSGSFFGSYDTGGSWQTKSFTMGYTGPVTNGQKQFVPSVGEKIKTEHLSLNTRYRIEWKGINENPTVDGVDCTVTTSKPFPDYTPSVNAYLCTRNQAGSVGVIDDVNIYGMTIKGKMKLIPAKRKSDGEVGMYDMVGGKFYGNSGTGEFIAGPETGNSFIADADGDITCVSCPANTYKPNAGNEQCTKCPDGTFSPIGSKELSDCAKILRINDYVVYMPLGKRTEHGLCVMWNDEKYCADVYKKQ